MNPLLRDEYSYPSSARNIQVRIQTKSDTQTNQIALAADETYTEGEASVKYNDGTLMTL